jgi:hypothetical protein
LSYIYLAVFWSVIYLEVFWSNLPGSILKCNLPGSILEYNLPDSILECNLLSSIMKSNLPETLKAIHNIVTQFQLQLNLSDFFILHAGMDIFYLKVVMVNIGVQRINNF